LYKLGVLVPHEIINKLQLWRLITPIMMHGSYKHLFSNMVLQYIIGNTLESYLGRLRFALLYWITGIYSSLFSTVILIKSPGVGASGADFGLLGMFIIYTIKEWSRTKQSGRFKVNFRMVLASFCIATCISLRS
jgi:rhomboid protease GluP